MSATAAYEPINGRPKNLAESKAWMLQKLSTRTHPMNALSSEDGPAYIDGVPGLDGQAWGSYWGECGDAVRKLALDAEASGDKNLAAKLWTKASGLYFMGRFPCPNHPAKERCATEERNAYVRSSQFWKEPITRVEIPFDGKDGEGSYVALLVRKPVGVARPRVVLMWGGVDACKEQLTAASDAFLAQGVATIAMDNAGTGESPVRGVPDAERQFITALDWIEKQNRSRRREGRMRRPLVRWVLGNQARLYRAGSIGLRSQLGRRRSLHVSAGVGRGVALPRQLSDGVGGDPKPNARRDQRRGIRCVLQATFAARSRSARQPLRAFAPGQRQGRQAVSCGGYFATYRIRIAEVGSHVSRRPHGTDPQNPADDRRLGGRANQGESVLSGSNWRQDMPTPDAYWMNRVLFDVHHKPSHLEQYKASPDDYMKDIPLDDSLKGAIRDNDIGAMYMAGVNPYLLRAHCLGLRIPEDVFVQSLKKVSHG